MSIEDTDALKDGTAHGCRFKVIQTDMGHFCGYVRTNLGPGWHYDDLMGFPHTLIEAHGGLTYGPDEDGWLGFDCAHAGDACVLDGETITDHRMNEDGTVWTPDDVAAECRKVARQYERVQELLEKFEQVGWRRTDG